MTRYNHPERLRADALGHIVRLVPGGTFVPNVRLEDTGVSFRMLGRLELVGPASTIEVPGALLRALLVRLTINPGRPVPADVLAEDVWGDAVSSGSIRVLLSRLRTLLAEMNSPIAITSTPGGYSVDLNGALTDRDRFCHLALAVSRTPEPQQSIRLAAEALKLWNGQPFAEVGDRLWAVPERERLLLVERSLRIRRADSYAAVFNYQAALSEFEILRFSYPFDESIAASTAHLLWQTGRRNDALNEIATIRRAMSTGVGLSLGDDLVTLERGLLNGDVPVPQFRVEAALGFNSSTPSGRRARLTVEAQFPPALSNVPFVAPRWFADIEGLLRRGDSFESALHILSGPAGSGKTRAAFELARAAEAAGTVILHGEWDREPCAPYGPLKRGLRLLTGSGEPMDLNPSGGFEDVLLSIKVGIESLLSNDLTTKIVWVLDDVHWADGDSLSVLRDVIRENSSSRFQFLVTTRMIRNRLPTVLERLVRDGFATHREMGCLDTDQLHQLCTTVNSNLSNKDVDELAKSCNSNPFLMLELSRAPINNEGTLTNNAGALYRNLIESLEPDTKTMLFTAALAGSEVNAKLLAEATEFPPGKLTKMLASLLEVGLLKEAAPNLILFDHDLARDLILTEISATERRQLHSQLGRALSTIKASSYARSDKITSLDIARHYVLAGQLHTGQAVLHLLAAVDELLDVGAPLTALETAKQAEDLVDRNATKERFLVLVGVAKALCASGNLKASRAEYDAAFTIAVLLSDPEAQAIAAVGMMGPWTRYWQPDPEVVGYLEVVLYQDLSPATLALSSARLAIAKVAFKGNLPESRSLSSAAMLGARSTNDQGLLVEALYARGRTLLGPDYQMERFSLAKEGSLLVQRTRVPASLECLSLQNLIIASVELAKVEELEDALFRLNQLAASSDQPFVKWRNAVIRTSHSTAQGDQEQAAISFQETRSFGSSLGLDAFRPTWFTQNVLLAMRFNDHLNLQSLEPAFAAVRTSDPILGQALAGTVLSFGGRDSQDKAAVILRSLSAHLGIADRDYSWLGTVALCVRLSQRLETSGITTSLRELLDPFRSQNIVLGTATAFLGPVANYLD